MRIYLLILSALLLFACSAPDTDADFVLLDRLDPEISEMINSVSADSVEKNIRTLSDFGTRHTLSETESDTVGIGAARRWIKAEMDRYSRDSGNRLEVEFHRSVQEPTRRITEPVELVNVVATLPGTDPNDDRIFVVSGHYDSRASHVMDAESDAPGAKTMRRGQPPSWRWPG